MNDADALAATPAAVLQPAAWDWISATAGTYSGKDLRLRCAQLWVWEMLTGGPINHAANSLGLEPAPDLRRFQRFLLRLSPVAANHLAVWVRVFLDEHGCAHEPTTWSPPFDWVDQTGLAEPRTDNIDPESVISLIRDKVSPKNVAAQLDTTVDHIYLIAQRHHPAIRDRFVSRKVVRAALPAELTPERLRSLVVDEHRSATWIADHHGLSRNAILAMLRSQGVPVPGTGRRVGHKIDVGWLRSQYENEGRTWADIAGEVGMSTASVHNIGQRNAITMRKRGRRRMQPRHAQGQHPEPLASALRWAGGIERTKRFQMIARVSSITHAAPSTA